MSCIQVLMVKYFQSDCPWVNTFWNIKYYLYLYYLINISLVQDLQAFPLVNVLLYLPQSILQIWIGNFHQKSKGQIQWPRRLLSWSSLPGGSADVTSSTTMITQRIFGVLGTQAVFCYVLTSSLRALNTGESWFKLQRQSWKMK